MGEEIKVVVLKLGEEEYGIEVDKIKTIEKIQPITRIPRTPIFVKGVINLRGLVIPVIDLRQRFGLDTRAFDANTRNIIVSLDDMEVGLVVDEANDVLSIDSDQIQTPPEIIGGIKDKYVKGVVQYGEKRLLILLDIKEVLGKNELT